MPPEKDERAILLDMLESVREVVSFANGRTRQDLDTDRVLLRALERTLELVAECARKVPESVRLAHTVVPRKAMVGMRNIIAHEYGRVNPDQIWRTAHR